MTEVTRTEEDPLGAREASLGIYWGIHALCAMENFQTFRSVVGNKEVFARGTV